MICENELSFKELLRLCQTNKDLAKKYITKLYEQHNPIYEKLIVNKPLLSLMSFTPLPYEFQTEYLSKNDTVTKSKNIYSFLGEPGNRILYANRRVPSCEKDAIPFTMPITSDESTELIQSNVFYYEVTILSAHIREPFENQCVSIGFGTNRTPYLNHVGWTEESWGFHSDDGNFMNANRSVNVTEPWGLGDTVGVGLIYDNKNEYRLLLTKNGIIIDDTKKIKTQLELYPMIGLDLSSPIYVNWGQKKFKFEIQKYISCNKIINNKITFLSHQRDILSYKFVPPQSLNKKINIFSFGDNIKKLILTEKISSISSLVENSLINKLGIKVLQYDPKTNEVNQETTNIDLSNNINPSNWFNNINTNNTITNIHKNYNLLNTSFGNYSLGLTPEYIPTSSTNVNLNDISGNISNIQFVNGWNINQTSWNVQNNMNNQINSFQDMSMNLINNQYVINNQDYINSQAVWPSVWNTHQNQMLLNNNLNVGGNINYPNSFAYWIPSTLSSNQNQNNLDDGINVDDKTEVYSDNDSKINDDILDDKSVSSKN